MNDYLKHKKWVIAPNCRYLIRELQRVSWKIYESAKKRQNNNVRDEIHKKDDHAPDSARYFFSMMPELYIPPVGQSRDGLSPNEIVKEALGAVTPPVGPIIIDERLRSEISNNSNQTEWTVIDEHMGGLF